MPESVDSEIERERLRVYVKNLYRIEGFHAAVVAEDQKERETSIAEARRDRDWYLGLARRLVQACGAAGTAYVAYTLSGGKLSDEAVMACTLPLYVGGFLANSVLIADFQSSRLGGPNRSEYTSIAGHCSGFSDTGDGTTMCESRDRFRVSEAYLCHRFL